MTDEPFFEPWPEPEDDRGDEERDLDLPWMPPVHVAGVVVPLAADVHRGDDTVVRVTHVVAYRRGLEVHVGAWLRPGTRRSLTSDRDLWQEQEPRVGFRLADGTRLGHRPPHGPTSPDPDEPTVGLAQTGGSGGGLSFSSSWWLHPLPAGATLEVVTQWQHQGVPESSVRLDLAALRLAAEHEDVLWDPPPPPEEEGFLGWAGHAPMGGKVHRSQWAMLLDDAPGPDGERA